ncbi:MAG: nucleotidyltransferase domain-containing protein [Candidatus Polarisedimenticolaceae bacterium]|nr:nucleotidyltransferase domain-containing protein [Candidatus Polarisedimenticolaceae bacterium]
MSESASLNGLQNIRLSRGEVLAIRSVMDEQVASLGEAALWLFGSRTDPEKRGGDIDLFLELGSGVDNLNQLRRQIRLALYDEIGEQKIDLLIKQPGSAENALFGIAREEGVLIWQQKSSV